MKSQSIEEIQMTSADVVASTTGAVLTSAASRRILAKALTCVGTCDGLQTVPDHRLVRVEPAARRAIRAELRLDTAARGGAERGGSLAVGQHGGNRGGERVHVAGGDEQTISPIVDRRVGGARQPRRDRRQT